MVSKKNETLGALTRRNSNLSPVLRLATTGMRHDKHFTSKFTGANADSVLYFRLIVDVEGDSHSDHPSNKATLGMATLLQEAYGWITGRHGIVRLAVKSPLPPRLKKEQAKL